MRSQSLARQDRSLLLREGLYREVSSLHHCPNPMLTEHSMGDQVEEIVKVFAYNCALCRFEEECRLRDEIRALASALARL